MLMFVAIDKPKYDLPVISVQLIKPYSLSCTHRGRDRNGGFADYRTLRYVQK